MFGCETPRPLIQPESAEIISSCNSIQVDVIHQYWSAASTAPTSNLVFSFANRSVSEVLDVEVGQMTLTDQGVGLTLSTQCKTIRLMPLEAAQCRIFWAGNTKYPLSHGATFVFPVHCGEKIDTVRCMLK
jgi:hypothetical protein